jgi:hypothetical protein
MSWRMKSLPTIKGFSQIDGLTSNGFNSVNSLRRNTSQKRNLQELLSCRQGVDETGVTYFYRACRMHSNSGIGLEESPLLKFIVEHMTPQYLDAFGYRHAMKDLKQAIILYDQRQRDEKAKKREVKRKRKSAAIAYLDADEKRAKVETGESQENTPVSDDFMVRIAAFMERSQQQNHTSMLQVSKIRPNRKKLSSSSQWTRTGYFPWGI